MAYPEIQSIIVDQGSRFVDRISPIMPGIIDKVSVEQLKSDHFKPGKVVVLSGGSESIIGQGGIRERYKAAIDLLEDVDTPLVGICLGMEAIAVANNIWLTRLEQKDEGQRMVRVINRSPIRWLSKVNDEFKVHFAHRWGVKLKDLPPSFIPLITTQIQGEEYVAAMRHAAKPIYAFQFHPEALRNTSVNNLWAELMDDIVHERFNSEYNKLSKMDKLGIFAREMAQYQSIKDDGIYHPRNLTCQQIDQILSELKKEGLKLGAENSDYAIAYDKLSWKHIGCKTHEWLGTYGGAGVCEGKDNDLARFIFHKNPRIVN